MPVITIFSSRTRYLFFIFLNKKKTLIRIDLFENISTTRFSSFCDCREGSKNAIHLMPNSIYHYFIGLQINVPC